MLIDECIMLSLTLNLNKIMHSITGKYSSMEKIYTVLTTSAETWNIID
jgi:hypothetical protein